GRLRCSTPALTWASRFIDEPAGGRGSDHACRPAKRTTPPGNLRRPSRCPGRGGGGRGVAPVRGRPVRRTAVPAPRLLNSWRAGNGARRCVVDFSERTPSKQWAALKYGGEKLAEVWFKPEGEPFALTFRIPRKSFQTPGTAARLTPENLLKAVGLATE